ncbi:MULTISPECIES: sugar-binding transcriptional regulator [Rothia]|uniref:Transcriptional regulator n=1 Tax=Rothia kristinae TaxID=37923 RepID=A0A199NS03_9MICC|nr:sugar-binding domain-containing protein [Rothia kristinae]TDP52936.1 DNA-binding transcriptional regulator LsrR (DeoR family) [Kocuria sp. AG109]MCT1356640.1 transcriptional regulator [Rothia kristinae]MCT1392458.1 transcriptional regulator [Rothia kristinae]MCT1505832.1 transcriptional regulator [Rothia kristinae]MCT2039060.1 transcriptional regulator [Rothia kristinae]
MKERDDLAWEVASSYYRQERTMDSIAHDLGISRATVSRLLKHARATGLVRIEIAPRSTGRTALADQIQRGFGVTADVVPVAAGVSELVRLEQVCRVAAEHLDGLLEPGTVLGLAWGSTITEFARHLSHRHMPDSVVVQLNGAGNASRTGIPYTGAILDAVAEAYGSRVVHFPVPAFFDYPETKQAMWRERSIRGVLEVQRGARVAVFGVGALHGAVPSHVYSSGYLEERDYAAIARDRVVGDVCTVLLRENGTWADVELNRRATGPTPEQLARIPRRLCVASGAHRVPALLGALRAGAITDLVIDEATARLLLERAAPARG